MYKRQGRVFGKVPGTGGMRVQHQFLPSLHIEGSPDLSLIHIYLIYDDTVIVTDKDGNVGRRVQFAQALQFGFTYTFVSKK